jgi:hypothetical protein
MATYEFTKVMDDTVTPLFYKRRREGEIIMNNCTSTSVVIDRPGGGSYVAVRKSDGCTSTLSGGGSITRFCQLHFGAISNLSVPFNLSTDEAKQRAISGVDNTPYQFAEDLLEIRQTLSYLELNTLSKLYKLSNDYFAKAKILKAAKRFRNLSPSEKARALSNLYLEYRFAFSPLVRSASDLIDSILLKEVKPDHRFSHGKGSDVRKSVGDFVTNTAFTFSRNTRVSASTYATIAYRVSNPVDDWRFKYGVRNKDLLAGLWEVFPLSFMVDRLLNIKGAIKGLLNLADPNINILGACVSSKSETTATVSLHSQPLQAATWNITITPDIDTTTTIQFNRTTWSPSVGDTVPVLTPGRLISSITSTADLIALIINRVR